MPSTVNAGGRLYRLPIGSFHRRVMWLVGIGMFFDGFDIYVARTVLGTTLKSGFSTLGQNAMFVSATFVGMMLGSFLTGFLGDRYGRRFTYQANLLVFGLASIAAAFAPDMAVLIGLPSVTDPVLLPVVGFALTIPIYVLVALLFGIYIPELSTEIRLRASGLCNTFGRGATIATPFLVVSLFQSYGVSGVLDLMIGLLILQILAVLILGIEPRNKPLEELKPEAVGFGPTPIGFAADPLSDRSHRPS